VPNTSVSTFLNISNSYTILPALSLDGIIDLVVVEGALNANSFMTFLEGLVLEMNPFPANNSTLVLDNVKFHHNQRVANLLNEQ